MIYMTGKADKSFQLFKGEGFRAANNYLRDLIKREEFIGTMLQMRTRYRISPHGFKAPETGSWPDPPLDWSYYGDPKIHEEIRQKLHKLCVENFLPPRDWLEVLRMVLFYNEILYTLRPNSYNLCFVSDGKYDAHGRETAAEDMESFPVALHISPYASKRSILKYVEDFYKTEIAPLQEKRKDPKSEMRKHKSKKLAVEKRNNLIYQNQRMPRKKLIAMVSSQFPEIRVDQGEIGKIISLENKRRKKA